MSIATLKTRCTNSWSSLTLKCNANTFVKVDAQTKENCRQAISHVQGSCCPKLQLQETGLSKTYGEYSLQRKKNNFMLNAGQDKKNFHSSNLLCICPSLFDTYPNKAKYSIYEKLSRVFSVAGFRFQEK